MLSLLPGPGVPGLVCAEGVMGERDVGCDCCGGAGEGGSGAPWYGGWKGVEEAGFCGIYGCVSVHKGT